MDSVSRLHPNPHRMGCIAEQSDGATQAVRAAEQVIPASQHVNDQNERQPGEGEAQLAAEARQHGGKS